MTKQIETIMALIHNMASDNEIRTALEAALKPGEPHASGYNDGFHAGMEAESALQTISDIGQLQEAVPPSREPLTPEKYTELAHRIASKYAHRSDPKHIAYTFLPHTLGQFVRCLEAAHGITGGKE